MDTLSTVQQIAFTLSRALISADDVLTLHLTNLGTGTYLGRVGVIRTAKLFYRMS